MVEEMQGPWKYGQTFHLYSMYIASDIVQFTW